MRCCRAHYDPANQAQEITANLRPNPHLLDTQFFPIFTPSEFNATYLENQAQFDLALATSSSAERNASIGWRPQRSNLGNAFE